MIKLQDLAQKEKTSPMIASKEKISSEFQQIQQIGQVMMH